MSENIISSTLSDTFVVNLDVLSQTDTTAEVEVRVADTAGIPLPGIPVAFTADNGGTVSPDQVVTDDNGLANTTVLDTAGGDVEVTASVAITQNLTLSFAGNNPEAYIARLNTTINNAVSEEGAKDQVGAFILDAAGQPLAGQIVMFSADSPAVVQSTAITDEHGVAYASVTSNTPGTFTVTATINDSSLTTQTTFIAQNMRIMGARRHNYAQRNQSGLVCINELSGKPEAAQWQYEGGTSSATATWFDDPHPGKVLTVRSDFGQRTLAPANLAFSGTTDTNNATAGSAVLENGSPVAWGTAAEGGNAGENVNLTDVITVISNEYAFCALRKNGSVVAWGNASYGGSVPSNIAGLTDIVSIYASLTSFCALRANGSVVAWGDKAAGGTVSDAVKALTDILTVTAASAYAYSALRGNGSVVAWGSAADGGTVPGYVAELQDIVQVTANARAFCALRQDGSVIPWGNASYGGNAPDSILALRDVVSIIGSRDAFCLLREDGSVQSWGNTSDGGNLPSSVAQLNDIVDISSVNDAFCALRNNGSVVAWGQASYGGSVPANIAGLTDIVSVRGSQNSFSALRSNGKIASWGDIALPSAIQSLTGVMAIYSGYRSFGALTEDGQLHVWGLGAGSNQANIPGSVNGNLNYYI